MATRTNNNDLRTEIDALKEDLGAVRGDMRSILEVLRDSGMEKAEHARDCVRAEAHERLEQLNEAYHRAQDAGHRAAAGAREKVEEHPLSSILIALGVGLVVGKLLDRG